MANKRLGEASSFLKQWQTTQCVCVSLKFQIIFYDTVHKYQFNQKAYFSKKKKKIHQNR